LSSKYIKYSSEGRFAYITIERPEVRNALNSECHRELREAFEYFRDDENAWVAVLSGVGRDAFCAGADLKDAARRLTEGRSAQDRVWGGITRDWDCDKPIIAAVNGLALGGGLELALACDVIVAADTAAFGLPEPSRGIIAGAGGIQRLIRQLPAKRALYYLLTGSRFDARTAMDWGLVHSVVPYEALMAEANRVGEELIAGAPLAVRLTKRLAVKAMNQLVDSELAAQQEAVAGIIQSRDAREGALAFVEKRPPRWEAR
jgi:enoyl-CoA hydratase/carnithine racemase